MSTWLGVVEEIEAAQNNKHLTANTTFRRLFILARGSALDKDLSTPPSTPADGDTYIVGASATGAWAGHDGDIAYYSTNAWDFIAPTEGVRIYLADANALYVYTGSAWVAL